MSCPECALSNQAEFSAEMVVHSSGLKNIDRPAVYVFPKILVCLDCGSARFIVPKSELASLADSVPTKIRALAAAG
jgi:hypothetical protein